MYSVLGLAFAGLAGRRVARWHESCSAFESHPLLTSVTVTLKLEKRSRGPWAGPASVPRAPFVTAGALLTTSRRTGGCCCCRARGRSSRCACVGYHASRKRAGDSAPLPGERGHETRAVDSELGRALDDASHDDRGVVALQGCATPRGSAAREGVECAMSSPP